MYEDKIELYVDTFNIMVALFKEGRFTHLENRALGGFVPYALDYAKQEGMWADYDSIVVHLTEESIKKTIAKYSNLFYYGFGGQVCLKVDSSMLPDYQFADDRIRNFVIGYVRGLIRHRQGN